VALAAFAGGAALAASVRVVMVAFILNL
jgi:hypothetical protein